METFDVIVAVLFIILCLIVLPQLLQLKPRSSASSESSASGEQRNHDGQGPQCMGKDASMLHNEYVSKSQDPLYLPSQALPAKKQLEPDAEMIRKYYVNASTHSVPTDYAKKSIGQCPESKAMSTSLPIGDVPMCFATSKNNMILA
jgi:hypothetical protein